MATSFENPGNGHQESVSGLSAVWAIAFGGLYYLFSGLIAHFVIHLVFAFTMVGALGGAGILIIIIFQFAYGFFAPSLLRSKYLRDGWIEITPDVVSQRTQDLIRGAGQQASAQSPKLAASGTSSSVIENLERLAALRDRGVLNEAQFEEQKAKILRRG